MTANQCCRYWTFRIALVQGNTTPFQARLFGPVSQRDRAKAPRSEKDRRHDCLQGVTKAGGRGRKMRPKKGSLGEKALPNRTQSNFVAAGITRRKRAPEKKTLRGQSHQQESEVQMRKRIADANKNCHEGAIAPRDFANQFGDSSASGSKVHILHGPFAHVLNCLSLPNGDQRRSNSLWTFAIRKRNCISLFFYLQNSTMQEFPMPSYGSFNVPQLRTSFPRDLA